MKLGLILSSLVVLAMAGNAGANFKSAEDVVNTFRAGGIKGVKAKGGDVFALGRAKGTQKVALKREEGEHAEGNPAQGTHILGSPEHGFFLVFEAFAMKITSSSFCEKFGEFGMIIVADNHHHAHGFPVGENGALGEAKPLPVIAEGPGIAIVNVGDEEHPHVHVVEQGLDLSAPDSSAITSAAEVNANTLQELAEVENTLAHTEEADADAQDAEAHEQEESMFGNMFDERKEDRKA